MGKWLFLLVCNIIIICAGTFIGHADASLPHVNALSLLPVTFPEKLTAPIRYRFTCDYYKFLPNGDFQSKECVSALYIENPLNRRIKWDKVMIAQSASFTGPFGAGDPQTYMDGFSYKLSDLSNSFTPDFFSGFPDKMESKSLVWDAAQIELFGTGFIKYLKLEVPYMPALSDANFPGGGTFHNRQVKLTWIGISTIDDRQCAQIDYEAPFNPLNFVTSGVKLNGLSTYHGLISVNLRDGQIERGTIEEEVVGTVVPNGAPAGFTPIVTHTIRDCIFQRE